MEGKVIRSGAAVAILAGVAATGKLRGRLLVLWVAGPAGIEWRTGLAVASVLARSRTGLALVWRVGVFGCFTESSKTAVDVTSVEAPTVEHQRVGRISAEG